MFLAVALVQWTWSLIVEKRWEGRRLEKLTSGTQIPALGKRSSAVSTAALIWADKVCPWVTLHLQLVICEWGESAQIGVPQNKPLFSDAQAPILHFVICVDVSGGSACLRFRSMSRSVSIGASKMESVSTTQQGFSLGEEVTVVTILLIPPFLCQLTPFERIWVEQCHWPSVKQVDLQQEEEGRRERSLPMEPFAQVLFCPNGGNLERSLPSLE
ncbi:hypothetical protein D4764_0125880 [Takifugu flavidus]|uniref:Uncharacterized protein n=1 Tax=Takifugu flavidus TaxID=433684 RepID=A0A5C6MGT9_9TELE|nr:hypothetical protein D4764_0125880 [Takifugu flavidus]